MDTYEKKYKEALERAKEKRDEYKRLDGEKSFVPYDIEYIFPELKESEDERIRKSIIELLNEVSCTFKYYDINEMLSWLEKQGNNNSISPGEMNKSISRSIALTLINYLDDNRIEGCMNLSSTECEDLENAVVDSDWQKIYNYMKKKLEKQGKNNMGIAETTKKKLEDNLNEALEKETPESWNKFLENQGEQILINNDKYQTVPVKILNRLYKSEKELEQLKQCEQKETLCDKCRKYQPSHSCQDISALGRCAIEHEQIPADKVEAKYRAGVWVQDEHGNVMKILDVSEFIYTVLSCHGDMDTRLISDMDSTSHLWSIQDAKDGDVLQLGDVTAIFKEFIGNKKCKCYLSIYKGKLEIPSVDDNVYNCYPLHPATKEQRDLLFQKMKEEGYEWNVEKKELKRLIKTHKVMSRQHHELKIKTKYFREIESGDKTFEVRYNDRNFQKYDILHLREYADGEYTSRKIDAEVTYILYDKEFCKEGYVIMAIKVINVIN